MHMPSGSAIRSGPQQPQQPIAAENAASPPSKRDLKSWWKGFKLPTGKHQETNGIDFHTQSQFISSSSRCSGVSHFSEDAPYTHPKLLHLMLAQHDACTSTQFPPSSPTVFISSDATSARRDRDSRKFGRFAAGLFAPFACLTSKPPLNLSSPPLIRMRPQDTKPCTAPETRPQGIFGVPLRQSITYANVAISLVDENGSSYIYGYVPIVVAKCGVFLKEKAISATDLSSTFVATEVEGIFRLNGSEKRIKELKTIFDSPDRYGKGLVWEGYTVHDASNVFRRYLNDLPEPVVPLDLYEKFREPLRGATKQASGDAEGPQFVEDFDEQAAIEKYQQLITELPPLNRQLLLYILDLLAVFAAKSEQNRMNSQNLAAIFQPGMLSHPDHAMAPEEYRLNQCVLIFLIENQDHFLIGMQGTAADEKTMQEVEQGTPVLAAPRSPSTPTPGGRDSNLGRSASNASAGAESVRRDGKIRRNRSTSSRHSRNEGGATPVSPIVVTTPTGGLARSNTVPSKKSPALASGRFNKESSPMAIRQPNFTTAPEDLASDSPAASTITPSGAGTSTLSPASAAAAGRSQERLLEPPSEAVSTPTKERNLQSLFQRSPTSEGDKRQRNKLKKRIPTGGTLNLSAHSSTASLPHSAAVSPGRESNNPLDPPPEDQVVAPAPLREAQQASPSPNDDSSEPTPRGSQLPASPPTLQPENSLKPKKSPSTSLHSSFNEGSELDQLVDEPVPPPSNIEAPEKEKKKRWRLSRTTKKEETAAPHQAALASPRPSMGTNLQAEDSSLSLASGSGKPRKSFTNDSSDPASSIVETQLTQESGSSQKERSESGKEESTKNPIGWIRNKYREAKETHEQRRNKSPPADNKQASSSTSRLSLRGKSLDLKREEERQAAHQQSTQSPVVAIEKQVAQPYQPQIQAAPAPQPQPEPPQTQAEAQPQHQTVLEQDVTGTPAARPE
ncbi:hypothetical protein jhhlp_004676 [Lomentospora prolificans]|uniref:Rho-GAP domain-containing protein n=1 Tax=Lomentospora prolificans TaxID=41688 RepID=A0A2N3NCA8_9PEZI|nr:hypothetical protein jhhlp_004676 [Lomentospora prolificans]